MTRIFVYFTYKVTDGGNCDATEDVEITINNTVPEAVADTFTVTVGGTINISAALGVLANDPIPAGASAESSIASSPSIAVSSSFRLYKDGSFTYTHDGSSSPKSDNFTYRMRIIYSNGAWDVVTGDVVIKVNNIIIKDIID